jgi:hypothetical protein
MAGWHEGRSRRETTVRNISPTPNIVVMIGGQVRVYDAYITTAGPELDGPSTMTLYASTLMVDSSLAADSIVDATSRGNTPARLVLMLMDLRELAWHRAAYRRKHCIFAPADPVLVSPHTLQHRLWQRLQALKASELYA